MTLRPEEIRPDCPRCSGTGLQAPRVLNGPIPADAIGDCQLCLEAAKKEKK